LIAHVLKALKSDCARVAVNAPRASGTAIFARDAGLPILEDAPSDPHGPLAGLKAGMIWADAVGAGLLTTAPCDTPNLPFGFVHRLIQALETNSGAAVVEADGLHPLCAVWRVDCLNMLTEALASGRHPPVRDVLDRVNATRVAFGDPRAFSNINTQADMAQMTLPDSGPDRR
jgi:molybdopterin-guanine dinucleotide biosynthesis protein A